MSQLLERRINPISTTQYVAGSGSSLIDMFMNIAIATIAQTITVTVNPKHNTTKRDQKIAKVDESGFLIDVNNMIVDKRYLINYDGSEYEIMKNSRGELEVFEVDFTQ